MKNGKPSLSIAGFCIVWICSLCLTSRAFPQSNSLEAVLTTVAQDTNVGLVVEVSADQVIMEVDGEKASYDLGEISNLTFGNPIADPITPDDNDAIWISLADGSQLLTEELSLAKRVMNIKTVCGIKSSISARSVEPVLLRPLQPPLTQAMWAETVTQSSKISDGLVVSRKGKLQTIEGVVEKMSEAELTFTVDEQTREIKRERLQGVYFFHPTQEDFAAPLCQAKLVDGSTINVRQIDIEESTFNVTSVCGAEFQMTSAAVAEINFASGRSVFLSDLEPTSNDWSPLIAHSMIVEKLKPFRLARTNRSFRDEPLSLVLESDTLQSLPEQKEFSHGFSIGGGGKLAFTLNGQFKFLTGLVGFDPAADVSGVIKFTIQVDGEVKLAQRLEHAKLTEPIAVEVDVANAKRLVVKVEYEDGRNVGDQIHFVDPKLSR